MLIGEFTVWMIYLPITFLTGEVFEECKSIKNKLVTLLTQVIASTAMIMPFCLIESLDSKLKGQIAIVLTFWLIIWVFCYFEHKKLVKILKRQPISKSGASN